MNNPQCAVCGHVNRAGAAACEACDARLYASDAAADAADPYGDAREPSNPAGGTSWGAPEPPEPGDPWAPRDEGIPAPPFKGAGDVISPMLAVYRKHFTLVGILVLVVTVPEALLQYAIMGATGAGAVPVVGAGAAAGFTVVGGLLLWLLSTAGGALLSGSLVHAVVDLQRAGGASAGDCLARGLKALPRVFLLTLLYTVIVGAGYVLLIVPGVILSLMFAVCVPVAVIEGRGPIDALKRSYEMTSGYKGLIFITYFLWGLLMIVLSWIVQWSFMNGAGLDLLPTLLMQTAVLGMLSSTVHVLTVYVYLGLLRERQSGFGAGAFTPAPEAAAH